jgi:hypothetical protein
VGLRSNRGKRRDFQGNADKKTSNAAACGNRARARQVPADRQALPGKPAGEQAPPHRQLAADTPRPHPKTALHTNGVTVNLPAGSYATLKGLDINGNGPTGNSLSGVNMVGGGSLTTEDCFIYGFRNGTAGNGVSVNGTTSAHVLIENTRILNNLIGVPVQPQSGVPISIIIERSVVEENTTASLSVVTGGTAVISQSTFAGAPIAIENRGGSVISYGNNLIRNAGLPTSTEPLL